MKDQKLKRLIATLNKTFSNDSTLRDSLNRVDEAVQDLMRANNVLRQRLQKATESLRSANSAPKREKIILELQELHHVYRCLDQHFVDIITKMLRTVSKSTTILAMQVGKDSVTHKALDAKHDPSRRAKNKLWDEWEKNSKKYSSKRECASDNYARIIEETGATISLDTFIRALMKSNRPDM
jgi:small-conductance mechanosensitive channel